MLCFTGSLQPQSVDSGTINHRCWWWNFLSLDEGCAFLLTCGDKTPNETAVGLSNSAYLSCLMDLKWVLDARSQSKNPALHHFILNMLCDNVNPIFLGPLCLLVTSRRGGTTAVVGVISRRNRVCENSGKSFSGPNSAESWLFCLWTLSFIPKGHSSVPFYSEINERLICICALDPLRARAKLDGDFLFFFVFSFKNMYFSPCGVCWRAERRSRM